MTQKDLARRCARGDAEAWDEFIAQYGPVIFGSARFTLQRVLGRAVDADVENVYQLVLLSLLKNNGKKLLTYEGRSDLSAWLRVVTSRHALNYVRSEKTGGTLRFRPLEDAPETSETRVDPVEIEPLLKGLKPMEKIALKMFAVDGLSYQEIADALNLPVNTISSHIHRAKKKLGH